MSDQTRDLIVFAIIGIIAGFLASLVVGGDGLIRYLVTGIIGAFVGGYLFKALGINLGIGSPLISQIVTAAIGAIVVVVLANSLPDFAAPESLSYFFAKKGSGGGRPSPQWAWNSTRR